MNIEKQWAIISYTLIAVLSGLYVALIIGASAFDPLLAAASLGLYCITCWQNR
jgi:hypothetical protein